MAAPKPFPGASDITLSSEWMSLSMTLVVRGHDGIVMYDREMAVPARASAFEAGEVQRDVGSHESISTGLLKAVQGLGFSVNGIEGCVEFSELVFVLLVMRDISNDFPIPQVDGGVVQELVVGCVALEKSLEPQVQRLSRGAHIINQVHEEFEGILWLILPKPPCDSPHLLVAILVSMDECSR